MRLLSIFVVLLAIPLNAQVYIPSPILPTQLEAQQTLAPRRSLSIAHYLKTKFLGATVDYLDPKLSKKKKQDIILTGEVKEIILNTNGYTLVLDDGERLSVLFEVTQSGDPQLARRLKTDDMSVQMQVLQAVQFQNSMIASIGREGAVQSGSLSSLDQLKSMSNNNSDFESGEEIVYTDVRTSRKEKGFAFVSIKGLFLESGDPVSVRLEKENGR